MISSLPALNVKTNTNHSPHAVILGAGASLAALCNGDRYGRTLPVLDNLVDVVGLKPIIAKCEVWWGKFRILL